MPRRFVPAPATGRKPQTGMRLRDGRPTAVIGQRLAYLQWLARTGALVPLARQELELWRSRLHRSDRCAPALTDLGLCACLFAAVRRLFSRRARRPPLRTELPAGSYLPAPLTAPVVIAPRNLNRFPQAAGQFDPSRPPLVAVSVHFLGNMHDLADLGVSAVAQSGDVFVGWANLDAVAGLAEHVATVYVEAVRGWLPTSGGAAPTGGGTTTGAGVYVPPTPLPPSAQGDGTRLAVIDLGFDFLHPALLDAAGHVRAAWLFDLCLPSNGSGTLFTTADLEQALTWYRSDGNPADRPPAITQHIGRLATGPVFASRPELQHHGISVAGLALGNGGGSVSPHMTGPPPVADAGVAPDAEPVLIAISSHNEDRFADGTDVHTAFQTAFADGTVPCVALMADSDNLGPHDGSLPGEQFLDDQLITPGRAIVLSAGNANHTAPLQPRSGVWHAQQDAPPGGGPVTFTLYYGPGAGWPDSTEIWFDAPPGAATADATVAAALSGQPSISQTTIPEGQPTDPPVVLLNAGTIVEATLQRATFSEAYCLRLVFRPQSGGIVAGTWTIVVTAVGTAHAWPDRNNGTAGRLVLGADHGADHTTLGSPAVSVRSLAVASVAAVGTGFVPSVFSGRGPVRTDTPPVTSSGVNLKPDLCAVGESISAPRASIVERYNGDPDPYLGDYSVYPSGTSYSAPQVAGACALVFQRYRTDPAFGGSVATWDDVRLAVLHATTRRDASGNALVGMPLPELDDAGNAFTTPPVAGQDGWDRACGHGLLDLSAILGQPLPAGADAWIAKAETDIGEVPFVAASFWHSSDIVMDDPALVAPSAATTGPEPSTLQVRVRNRGQRTARDVSVEVWWAPLGALHPLPRGMLAGHRAMGSWVAQGLHAQSGEEGNRVRLDAIEPNGSGQAVFQWLPPRDDRGRIRPVQILATVDADGDRHDPDQMPCADNNVAFLTLATVTPGADAPAFTINGSDDIDGAVIWREGGDEGFVIRQLPVVALPWREAAVYVGGPRGRPLYGGVAEIADPASTLAATSLTDSRQIEARTDVRGASRLELRDGRVDIWSAGRRLDLPRLRIHPGAGLHISVQAPGASTLHLLHLSGGRRVGGGTVRWAGD
jgi:Subtilase family